MLFLLWECLYYLKVQHLCVLWVITRMEMKYIMNAQNNKFAINQIFCIKLLDHLLLLEILNFIASKKD